jgi:hypothetical protein
MKKLSSRLMGFCLVLGLAGHFFTSVLTSHAASGSVKIGVLAGFT